MSFSILGTGSALPERTVSNQELSGLLDTSDEWIVSRTGIHQRPILTEGTLAQLAAQAAQKALEESGTAPEELDLILCTTVSGDHISPALACSIQGLLGASCPAYDLSAACAAFIFALDCAAGYFARGRVRRVLVVSAERMSRLVDWNDRATCVLFGDGAAAAVLGPGEDGLYFHLTTQGDPAPLYIPHLPGNCPFADPGKEAPAVHMKGQEVFKFAVSSICDNMARMERETGIPLSQVDHLVLHQANARILDAAIRRLGVPEDKVVRTIGDTANLSSACIPLAIDRLNRSGKLRPGQLVACTGFGAGFVTGTCLLRWSI